MPILSRTPIYHSCRASGETGTSRFTNRRRRSSVPLVGTLRPERRLGCRRIVGPRVPGIASAHLLGDFAPATAPKFGQVAGGLDRAAGGRGYQQGERNAAVADRRVGGQAEQRLRADLHRGTTWRAIVDRVRAP